MIRVMLSVCLLVAADASAQGGTYPSADLHLSWMEVDAGYG
jgi:hypothetical protein